MTVKVAKYRGRCRYCKMYISPGDRVYWEPVLGGVHEDCKPYFDRRQKPSPEPEEFMIERYREERDG